MAVVNTDLNALRFNNLPEVLYAQVDTAEVEASIITIYEGIMNTTLFPGDPVRLFLSTLAAVIAQQNAVLDWTGKQNLLRYATGAYLEHLGAWLDVFRMEASPAKTVLKFSINEPRTQATVIPQGTRLTVDGRLFFETDVLIMISPGSLSAEVSATCLTAGIIGNGFIPGQINNIVDPIPFVTEAENTKTSEGGSEIEDDERLRNRIRISPESFTTAGATLAYVYWALSAHGNIGDVSVEGPAEREERGEVDLRLGEVDIFVMLLGGEVPEVDSDEVKAVKFTFGVKFDGYDTYNGEHLPNWRKIRPLTDFVHVHPIIAVDRNYIVKWFITDAQAVLFNEINERIQAAVAEYEVWQKARAGRDINPDRLIELCRGAGAKRVEIIDITDPNDEKPFAFFPLDLRQVVRFIKNDDRIQFGGIERD